MGIHGLWCSARTFPTKCPSCAAQVFFFSCGCGSRVFFDELGAPWPKHHCGGGDPEPEGGNGAGPTFGLAPDRASALVRAYAHEHGLSVPRLSWEKDAQVDEAFATRARRTLERRGPITRVEPSEGPPRTVVGVIREVIPGVKPCDRWRVRPGTILERQVHARIGPVVTQITVHAGAGGEGQLESYTVWASPRDEAAPNLVPGIVLEMNVKAAMLAPEKAAWVAVKPRL